MVTHKKNAETIHKRIAYIEQGLIPGKHEKEIEKINDASPVPCFVYIDGGCDNVIKILQKAGVRSMPAAKITGHDKIIPSERGKRIKQIKDDYRNDNRQQFDENKLRGLFMIDKHIVPP
jgi:hypothetical protein